MTPPWNIEEEGTFPTLPLQAPHFPTSSMHYDTRTWGHTVASCLHTVTGEDFIYMPFTYNLPASCTFPYSAPSTMGFTAARPGGREEDLPWTWELTCHELSRHLGLLCTFVLPSVDPSCEDSAFTFLPWFWASRILYCDSATPYTLLPMATSHTAYHTATTHLPLHAHLSCCTHCPFCHTPLHTHGSHLPTCYPYPTHTFPYHTHPHPRAPSTTVPPPWASLDCPLTPYTTPTSMGLLHLPLTALLPAPATPSPTPPPYLHICTWLPWAKAWRLLPTTFSTEENDYKTSKLSVKTIHGTQWQDSSL